MHPRTKWIDRRFTFDFPAGVAAELLERLRGTPARVEERVKYLPPATLLARPAGGWSIQEHVGHLSDLESLFNGRLDDYSRGLPVLRAADMSNRETWEAQHNDRPMAAILRDLRVKRERIVDRLARLSLDELARTALHPRLQMPMRIVDSMYFHATHDDYHLASISDILVIGD